MNDKLQELRTRYEEALHAFILGKGAEEARVQAYECGRSAIVAGLGLLDVVSTHHAAMSSPALQTLLAADSLRTLETGGEFLREALAPFEVVSRGYSETNARLRELTQTLEARVTERTAELQAKNEELSLMSQQLWQTAKLATMGELAASIAHELNNPLSTVTLRVESLLAQIPEGESTHRALEIVEGEVDRMGTLVANLLQFSRPSQLQISTIDLAEEATRSLELISYHLRNRQVVVVEEFALDAPTVQMDRQRLRQIFLNLITNASDAMSHGGTLTIRIRRAEGDSAMIELQDTGTGIPPEDLARVRQAFFTTKGEGKGTGLGLPICDRIIQEHGGTLEILSEVGVGTTMRIVLPSTTSANAEHLLSDMDASLAAAIGVGG
jgi:two-component system, LuxR family, sensor kinase FixL